MSILLVEDDRDLAELWCEYLRGRGHTISTCHSVQAAVEALSQGPPRLLIVDYTLPDGTAADVLEVARHASPPPKMVICSGHGSDLPDAVLGAGVHVLAKPFRLDQLDATIAELLGQR